METQNNNIQQTSTHAQQAKKLRRQRTRQIVASIFGIAILVCGIVKTSMIFSTTITPRQATTLR